MKLVRLYNQAVLLGLSLIGAWILVLLSHRADLALLARDEAAASGATAADQLTSERTPTSLTIHFDRNIVPTALAEGWSGSEPKLGTWSLGHRAVLKLKGLPDGPARITLTVEPFLAPGLRAQRVGASAQGRRLADWRLDRPGAQDLTLVLPADARSAGGEIVLELDLPDAASRARLTPESKDAREVAINLKVLTASVVGH